MPRIFSVSSRKRSWLRASSVALTTLAWLPEPRDFRQHVLDASRFDDRPHAATRDHTRSGGRRAQQHTATAELADHLVRDRVQMHGDFHHRLAGTFGSLADRLRHLVGLAETAAYLAVVVTCDDQRAERETTATFHDLGASVDEDHLLGRLAPHGRAVFDWCRAGGHRRVDFRRIVGLEA